MTCAKPSEGEDLYIIYIYIYIYVYMCIYIYIYNIYIYARTRRRTRRRRRRSPMTRAMGSSRRAGCMPQAGSLNTPLWNRLGAVSVVVVAVLWVLLLLVLLLVLLFRKPSSRERTLPPPPGSGLHPSPLEDSRLFGPSPWKVLAAAIEKNISEQPSPWRKSSKRESCYGDWV